MLRYLASTLSLETLQTAIALAENHPYDGNPEGEGEGKGESDVFPSNRHRQLKKSKQQELPPAKEGRLSTPPSRYDILKQ